ncbi:metallophosphoesterase [Candidatus Gottesmanbacteria bacterium]|nr:metallophosphoesterase [Candidatus Gottesmanbacteria bacterium]
MNKIYLVLLVLVLLVGGLGIIIFSSPSPRLIPTPTPMSGFSFPSAETMVLLAAGDIADCETQGDEQTAEILALIPEALIVTLGDNNYSGTTASEYKRCFGPSWGRFMDRLRPAQGNHDIGAGYYEYFGESAGKQGKGYYSFDLGSWHLIALNSNCPGSGGCSQNSDQYKWLVDDLEKNNSHCTLAYWHHPLFSSGNVHGNDPRVRDFWELLYTYGVELVLNGHEHLYERFSAQTPDGEPDPERGIVEFIVGTGGKSLYTFASPMPNSVVRNNSTFGVLKLMFAPSSYTWEFIPVDLASFSDSGRGNCH